MTCPLANDPRYRILADTELTRGACWLDWYRHSLSYHSHVKSAQ
jgi:hypothetical protein